MGTDRENDNVHEIGRVFCCVVNTAEFLLDTDRENSKNYNHFWILHKAIVSDIGQFMSTHTVVVKWH